MAPATRTAGSGTEAARTRVRPAAIVETAESIVDREGWHQLTMSGLAQNLGVRAPSLYKHVDSIEAVLGEVQVRALAELSNDLQRAAMGKVGTDAVRSLAAVLQEFAARHPGRYDLAMSEPIDPDRMMEAGQPASDALSAVMRSFGNIDVTTELQVSCLAALHGVIALGRTGLLTDVIDADAVYERAIRAVILLLEDEGEK